MYSIPANTLLDRPDQSPRTTVWFRDIDLTCRNGTVALLPLFHKGRLFTEGIDELIAVHRGGHAFRPRIDYS